MTFHIGILVPSTTNKRDWTTLEETTLYKVFLKSFLTTYSKEYEYTLYLVIDNDDKVYSKESEISKLTRFLNIMKNIKLKLIYLVQFVEEILEIKHQNITTGIIKL